MLYVFSLNCTLSRLKLSDRFVIVAKCKIIFWFVTLFAYKVYCALLLSNLFRIIDFLAPMTSLLSSASPSFPWATIPLTKLRVRGFPKSPTPQMVSAQLVWRPSVEAPVECEMVPEGQIYWPFPSSHVPLFQSESKCKTILMKMTLICMKMKLHAELIFIWKVSHLDSFWNRGTRELGDGLFARDSLYKVRFSLDQQFRFEFPDISSGKWYSILLEAVIEVLQSNHVALQEQQIIFPIMGKNVLCSWHATWLLCTTSIDDYIAKWSKKSSMRFLTFPVANGTGQPREEIPNVRKFLTCNVSVKSKLQHPPPGIPRAFDAFSCPGGREFDHHS